MDSPPLWITILIAVLFVAMPLGFFALGCRMTLKALRFKERAQPVTGTVVEVKTIYSIGAASDIDRYSYQPVFEFTSPDGGVLRGTSASAGSGMNYAIGSQHPILVDFGAPDIVHTKGNHMLIVAVGCILIGGIMACVGIYALLTMGQGGPV